MAEGELISRTDSFIGTLKQRPLWSSAWGICLVCLAFLCNVLWNLGEARARAEAYNAKARTIWMTGQKLATVTQTLDLLWSEAITSAEYYSTQVTHRGDRWGDREIDSREGLGIRKKRQGSH
jgi:hypothetical protein